MKCEKCKYCVQVSANEYKVRCANKKIAESKDFWVVEPSYCAYYKKGKTDIFENQKYYAIMEQLSTIKRTLEENK